nr:MAG TPA: hypothetical protein [Caudoviricetes sp.]
MVSGSQASGLGAPARMASRCIALASGMGGSGRMCVMSQRAAIWVRVAAGRVSPRRPAMMSSRSRPPAAARASGLYPIHWRLRRRRQVPMGVGVRSVIVGSLRGEEGGETGGDAVGVVGVCAHVLGGLPDVGGGAAVLLDVGGEERPGPVSCFVQGEVGLGGGGVCCRGVTGGGRRLSVRGVGATLRGFELVGAVDGTCEGVAGSLPADLGDGSAAEHLGWVLSPGATLSPEAGLACFRLVPCGGELVVGVVLSDECGGDGQAVLADAELVASPADDGGHDVGAHGHTAAHDDHGLYDLGKGNAEGVGEVHGPEDVGGLVAVPVGDERGLGDCLGVLEAVHGWGFLPVGAGPRVPG